MLIHLPHFRLPIHCYFTYKFIDEPQQKIYRYRLLRNKHGRNVFQTWFDFCMNNSECGFITVFKQILYDILKQECACSVRWSDYSNYYNHYKHLLNVYCFLHMNISLIFQIPLSKFRCSSFGLCADISKFNNNVYEIIVLNIQWND